MERRPSDKDSLPPDVDGDDADLFWKKLQPAKRIKDTYGWPPDCLGAFHLIECLYWGDRDALPNDDNEMARITGLGLERFQRLKSKLMRHAEPDGEFWRFPDWDCEFKDARRRHAQATNNGRLGGQASAKARRDRAGDA